MAGDIGKSENVINGVTGLINGIWKKTRDFNKRGCFNKCVSLEIIKRKSFKIWHDIEEIKPKINAY